ncbi:17082_t:CDS:2, partial [Gigaspora margarita]
EEFSYGAFRVRDKSSFSEVSLLFGILEFPSQDNPIKWKKEKTYASKQDREH